MPSKWAQAKAESQFGGMGGSNLINRIAEALDAARIEGLEEAAKIVSDQHLESIKMKRGMETVDSQLHAWRTIRARIEEMKG